MKYASPKKSDKFIRAFSVQSAGTVDR